MRNFLPMERLTAIQLFYTLKALGNVGASEIRNMVKINEKDIQKEYFEPASAEKETSPLPLIMQNVLFSKQCSLSHMKKAMELAQMINNVQHQISVLEESLNKRNDINKIII